MKKSLIEFYLSGKGLRNNNYVHFYTEQDDAIQVMKLFAEEYNITMRDVVVTDELVLAALDLVTAEKVQAKTKSITEAYEKNLVEAFQS